MRDGERKRGLGRVRAPTCGRTLHLHLVPAKDQQVQVHLARPPTLADLAPKRPLQTLERHQQGRGARRGVRPGGHVQRNAGVPELRLVQDAHRIRGVETRDTAQADPRQRRQRMDRRRQRPGRFANVGTEPDVRPHPTHGWSPPAR